MYYRPIYGQAAVSQKKGGGQNGGMHLAEENMWTNE
jgi:hypothetical protein